MQVLNDRVMITLLRCCAAATALCAILSAQSFAGDDPVDFQTLYRLRDANRLPNANSVFALFIERDPKLAQRINQGTRLDAPSGLQSLPNTMTLEQRYLGFHSELLPVGHSVASSALPLANEKISFDSASPACSRSLSWSPSVVVTNGPEPFAVLQSQVRPLTQRPEPSLPRRSEYRELPESFLKVTVPLEDAIGKVVRNYVEDSRAERREADLLEVRVAGALTPVEPKDDAHLETPPTLQIPSASPIRLPNNAKFDVIPAALVVAAEVTPATTEANTSGFGKPAAALDGRDGRNLALDQFRAQSTLVVPEHILKRAKFPVVDVHVHPEIRLHHSEDGLDTFVKTMDAQNIALCVSLDGRLELLEEHTRYLRKKYDDRFVVFANIDWSKCDEGDFVRRTVEKLEAARRDYGICGLKIFKDLGLVYKHADGSYVKLDDPRWDPIWAVCGKLGLPVIIHSGDPPAFFQPIDERNERWEELHRHPEWSFYGPQFPKRESLLAAFLAIVERHPQTTFIGAHVAGNSEDLATTAKWLDKYPNLMVEIASRISELGRQPYTARKFFLKYADRLLFGTDGPRVPERLFPYWRFLETDDEYFPYAENPFPPQGLWNIYGIYLPDDVLKKVYHENAMRVIPGVREKLAKRMGR